MMLEWRVERKAAIFFYPMAQNARVVGSAEYADQLDEALGQGILSWSEHDDLLLADLVVRGRRRTDQAEVYYLAEVSAGVGMDDVRRAIVRAAILSRVGTPAVPVVVGEQIIPEADASARARGVWQMLDGRVVAPSQSV
jgi:hypothetical protein